jgi:hypothetical protein
MNGQTVRERGRERGWERERGRERERKGERELSEHAMTVIITSKINNSNNFYLYKEQKCFFLNLGQEGRKKIKRERERERN